MVRANLIYLNHSIFGIRWLDMPLYKEDKSATKPSCKYMYNQKLYFAVLHWQSLLKQRKIDLRISARVKRVAVHCG